MRTHTECLVSSHRPRPWEVRTPSSGRWALYRPLACILAALMGHPTGVSTLLPRVLVVMEQPSTTISSRDSWMTPMCWLDSIWRHSYSNNCTQSLILIRKATWVTMTGIWPSVSSMLETPGCSRSLSLLMLWPHVSQMHEVRMSIS